MLTINDVLSLVNVCLRSGQLEDQQWGAPQGIAQDDWCLALNKAVADGFLLQVAGQTGFQYFLAGSFVVVDGDLYRVLATGSERETETFVNAASVTRFNQHHNGRSPHMISCFVPSATLRKASSFPQADSVEEVIRAAFDDYEGVRMSIPAPISIAYRGVVGNFMVTIKKRQDHDRPRPALHITQLLAGRLLDALPVGYVEHHYRLTHQNELIPTSLPCEPRESFLEQWQAAGLTLPTLPAETQMPPARAGA